MSILDKASLIQIPSGYKSTKLYSLRPSNGDGDFTFARSSSATRVNSEGLIEKGRENLMTYSNTFNVSWSNNGDSIVSGQSGYDGSNDAWLFTTSASSQYLAKGQSVSGVQTFSVYAKAGTADGIVIRFIGGSNPYVFWNLNDGSYAGSGGGAGIVARESVSVGNGWYRVSITMDDPSTSVRIYCGTSGGAFAAGNIIIQDAQLEQGLVATDYIETTTTTEKAGIFEDVPRLDYSGGASCASLLLEPQRTNLITYSEDFSQSVWGTWQATKTQSNNINPKGTNGYYEISHTGSSSNNPNTRLLNVSLNGSYTLSFFVKINQSRYISLSIEDYDGDRAKVYFDTINKTFTTISNVGSPITNTAYSEFSNDWIRISLSVNLLNAVYNEVGVGIYNPSGSFPSSSGEVISVFGAQLEEGSYPTSYIISNSGSSTTRSADVCNNAGTSATFNDSEGVLFFEGSALSDGTNQRWIAIGSGSNANRVSIHFNATNRISCSVRGSSSAIYDADFNIGSQTNNTKAAIKYKDSDYAFFVNGVKVDSQQSGSLNFNASLSELAFDSADGGSSFYGKTKQLMVFDEALSDEELSDLTGQVNLSFNNLATFYGYTIL